MRHFTMHAAKVTRLISIYTALLRLSRYLDFNLHIYDTTVGPRYEKNGRLRLHYDSTNEHSTSMKVHKSIRGIPEGWTITDSHLSHDNERCAGDVLTSCARIDCYSE